MLINKENKDYRINSFNVNSIIILSTFAILLLYLSSIFLFGIVKQVWADSVIDNIPVGSQPSGVAYSGDGEMYVTNFGRNTVSVIDTSTNKVVATIHVGKSPSSVSYDSDYGRAYVTNSDSNTISVVSTTSSTQSSSNNNNATTAKGFGGHGGNSSAITENTNSSHSNHGGSADGN